MSLRNMEQIQNVMQSSTLRDDARLMQPSPDAMSRSMVPAESLPDESSGPYMPPVPPSGRSMGAAAGLPMPPMGAGGPLPGVGLAALGGMSEEELRQGFAQEAAATVPPPKETLNTYLTKPKADGNSIELDALNVMAEKAGIETSKGLPMEALIGNLPGLGIPITAETGGGLMNLMMRDLFSGQVPGQGHGMEDNVYMPIVQRQEGNQVGTLAVSPDEYVVDAHTMSALGNGSADAGANVMDQVVQGVREKAYGTTQQPNEINGLAALRPMLERV